MDHIKKIPIKITFFIAWVDYFTNMYYACFFFNYQLSLFLGKIWKPCARPHIWWYWPTSNAIVWLGDIRWWKAVMRMMKYSHSPWRIVEANISMAFSEDLDDQLTGLIPCPKGFNQRCTMYNPPRLHEYVVWWEKCGRQRVTVSH